MCQPGKRHGGEPFGDSGEPLAKRRAIHCDTPVGQECHSSGENYSDGHGISDNLALLEDFSIFFADDLDAELPNLGDSTTAAQVSPAVDDLIDGSFFYDEALPEIPPEVAAANAAIQPPPSSVIRAFDRGSRSADEFDPNLLHSPPKSSSTVTGDGACEPPDLPLTQEADWESIRRDLQQSEPRHKGMNQAERDQLPPAHGGGGAALPTPAASAPSRDARVPTCPETASPSKPYRTFFHLKEMVQGKLEMYKNQPLVVFEWYARVLYSSRENFYRKQYFQFRDLFKETPPYLSGALLG
ncbi:hypothetical protein HRG_010433 [Hirsutella rhossiliensis]|uniref:Uncharacterized protein n=1 Tax=Hirsutella rhossiliensis TaxID=111463 RepID=A0A9P8SF79_9HYPO|nr:uncharacterized protein HRG_10433 [Hirsutella rhossiliensis]KAH0958746.1 hypothetical protein HRG_10433 [Hirsutella rhossiliensis]